MDTNTSAPYPRLARVKVTDGRFAGECGIIGGYNVATRSYTVLLDDPDHGGTKIIDAADLELHDEPDTTVPDHAIEANAIEFVAQINPDGTYTGHAYIATEVVFTLGPHPADEYDGLGDFLNFTRKRFAARLRSALADAS